MPTPREYADRAEAEISRLNAEVARLRAALQEIVTVNTDKFDNECCDELAAIASAAIAPAHGQPPSGTRGGA